MAKSDDTNGTNPTVDEYLNFLDRFLRLDSRILPEHLSFLNEHGAELPPVDVVLTDFEEAITKILKGKYEPEYLRLWATIIEHYPQVFHFDPAPIRVAKEKRLFENQLVGDVLSAFAAGESLDEASLSDILAEIQDLHHTQKLPFHEMKLGAYGARAYVRIMALGLISQTDEDIAFFKTTLEDLVSKDDDYGAFIYASLHEKGEYYPKNEALAEKYYLKSAKNHVPSSLIALGDFYRKRDPYRAFVNYTKAALENDTTGVLRVADCLIDGLGVEPDIPYAYDLLSDVYKAALADFIRAEENFENLAEVSSRLGLICCKPGPLHDDKKALHHFVLARFLLRREGNISGAPANEKQLAALSEEISTLMAKSGATVKSRVPIPSLATFFTGFPHTAFILSAMKTKARTLTMSFSAADNHPFLFVCESGGYAYYGTTFSLLFHDPVVISPPLPEDAHPLIANVRSYDALRIMQFIATDGKVLVALQCRSVELIKDTKWKENNH